jgi:DNA-binding MarR family transcriptional regulator
MREAAVLAWMRLVRVFQKVDRASVEHLRQWDLSVAQFDVLAQIAGNAGLTQQELADRLLVTKGNVCQLLDRMERHGLLIRQQEGRANRLYLTPEGQRLAEQVVPAQEAVVARCFAPLNVDEQKQLLALLRKLDRGFTSPL